MQFVPHFTCQQVAASSREQFRYWNETDLPGTPSNVCSWRMNGRDPSRRRLPALTPNGHPTGAGRPVTVGLEMFVLPDLFLKGGSVLACFDTQWPNLILGVA